jgi:amino acid transporter
MENDTSTKEPASQFDLTQEYFKERKNFRKDFGRKEVLFFSLCSVIGLDTIALVAAAGPQAISWMAVLAIVFLIPAAMVFAELSSTFTFQGGPYMWVRLAFGRFAGSIVSVISWIKSPIWLGGVLTIVVIAAAETFFMAGDQMSEFSFYRFALAFIWISVLANNYSFRVGKWVPVLGVLSRLILIPLFTITVIAFASVNGMQGVAFSDFGLSFDGLILTIPIILFAFLGLENVSAASAEMSHAKRDLPYAVFRTTAFSMFMYGIPILAVLLVLPVNKVDGITGFVDALKTVFTVYGGGIAEDGTVTLSGAGVYLGGLAGVLIILTIFSTGVTWLMSTNRNLAMACFDGSGPRWLGHTNPRYGTPVRLNNITGILASAILILGYQLNEGDLAKYFGVSISFAVAASLVTYLGIFPAFWVLRDKFPDVDRPYRVRAHRTVAIWLTLVVAFGISQLLAPGLGDRWFGNNYLPAGWVGDQGRPYYLTQFGVLGIMIVIAALFRFLSGGRTKVDGPEEISEELAEEPLSEEPVESDPESDN